MISVTPELFLDGTLINTDKVINEALRTFLAKKYGKQWDGREAHKAVGKTPLEAVAAIVDAYDLPCTSEEFLKESTPLLSDQ